MLEAVNNCDIAVFQAINGLPHTFFTDNLALAIHFLTLTGGVYFVIFLWFLLKKSQRAKTVGIAGFVSLLLTYLVVEVILKNIFGRLRPVDSLLDVIIVGITPLSFSFPSGQSASAAAAFIPVFLLSQNQRLIWITFSLMILTFFDRIYMGHHFPSDVAVGGLVGASLGIISVMIVKKIKNKPLIRKLTVKS